MLWSSTADARGSRIDSYSGAKAYEAWEVNRNALMAAAWWVAALALPPLAVGIL